MQDASAFVDGVSHALLAQLMPYGFGWLADAEQPAAVDNDSLALATAIYSLRHLAWTGSSYSEDWYH